jgi:7-keto-8-aminopelargonate synthetase-like enzyme
MSQPVSNVFAMVARLVADQATRDSERGCDFTALRVARAGDNPAQFFHATNPRAPGVGERPVYALGTTNYLGASQWPETKEKAKEVIDRLGAGVFGTCVVSGETVYHEELKQALAQVYYPDGSGRAFLVANASLANISVIPALVGNRDYILYEEENHQTLNQGAQLSQATILRYRHNDLQHLESRLQLIERQDAGRERRRLIVTDGVFSMSGHLCDLPRLIALAKQYGARLLIDESHALGTVGPRGLGTCEHFGVDPRDVHVITGTLGKSLGASGGYVVARSDIAEEMAFEYLTNRAFSSVCTAVSAAAAAVVVQQMLSSSETRYSRAYRQLRKNVAALNEGLLPLRDHGYRFEPEASPASVQRLIVGDPDRALAIQQQLYHRGVYALAYVHPIVAKGADMLRFIPMAALSDRDMEAALEIVLDTCKRVRAA